AATSIELYRGPPQAAAPNAANGQSGETKIIDHTFALAELAMTEGTQLALHGTAADYRPDVGRTISPRRITIIGREELDARVADRQSQITRRIEEALTTERKTRDEVAGLEIQLRTAGNLSQGDKDTLQAAETAQRRVSRMLADPADGLPAQIKSLHDE